MSNNQRADQKLHEDLRSDIKKIEKAKKDKSKIFAQTAFLGTIGLLFILPIVFGGYVGIWLDNKLKGFSISWTITLIFLGVIIGAINVYFFIKE